MIFLVAGIMMIGGVFAFAVSSQYWEENPLTINPGETQHAFIILQNIAGTENVSAKITVLQGSDIATLDNPDMVYDIPLGQRVQVNFTVTVPVGSQIGGKYNVIFDISTVSPQGAGTMTFGAGMQKLIPVLITQTPPPQKQKVSPWVYYLVAGIIFLIIIILIVINSKKNKKKSK